MDKHSIENTRNAVVGKEIKTGLNSGQNLAQNRMEIRIVPLEFMSEEGKKLLRTKNVIGGDEIERRIGGKTLEFMAPNRKHFSG